MKDQAMSTSKLLSMPGYVYQVPASNARTMVRISSEDDILVSSYCKQHVKPRTTIIHLMIGQATKCWEEKHEEKLKEMQEMGVMRLKLAAAEHIMSLYAEKYGPLRVKRNVRDFIIKPEGDSLDKPGS